jgi:hypothetical protein
MGYTVIYCIAWRRGKGKKVEGYHVHRRASKWSLRLRNISDDSPNACNVIALF